MSDEKEMLPEERAVRAMALLAEAKRVFSYSPAFCKQLDMALVEMASWSVGLIADYERDKENADGRV